MKYFTDHIDRRLDRDLHREPSHAPGRPAPRRHISRRFLASTFMTCCGSYGECVCEGMKCCGLQKAECKCWEEG